MPSSGFSDSKTHYPILDGLRGVAAVMVVLFHILETFSGGDHTQQVINHGYLAVDFFFVLSGFVIGYAYDDRWGKMSLGGFFKRRLIRLHPMIIMGMLIGAITFYFQNSHFFPGIQEVPVWKMLLVMLVGFTLLPVPPSMDIRGWTEMHPLNGPAWSLFYEYIANILYALFIRRLPNALLAILVIMAGAALVHLAVWGPQGDVIGGWAIDAPQMRIGITRLLYPFFAGLLLSRIVKPGQISHAFLWCSLLLVAILAFPRLGGHEHLWMNGIYDSMAIIIAFPLIVYLGASGSPSDRPAARMSKFLGDISYPIYIIHYPLIYLFMAWISKNNDYINAGSTGAIVSVVIAAIIVLASAIGIAYACVKLYDVPVRKWLMKRLMIHSK
ncbi:MAG: acyltransferase [Chitinophagaceae bacterium]|nr:acyltransferase [Chitinophagaceae bacterium]